MLKSRDGCGEDMGRRGCQWRMVGLCNASKLEWGNGERWGNGGMEGIGGKGLMAMNRLVIGL
ncbi:MULTISPECIES: hypothetical protein [unclassified Bartonella]|uniref:hypothetical protein n=1 Tax=unclassified Bartonella TaxID=2645622 RepID=UPI0035CF29E4